MLNKITQSTTEVTQRTESIFYNLEPIKIFQVGQGIPAQLSLEQCI